MSGEARWLSASDAARHRETETMEGDILKTIIVKWIPEKTFGYGKAMQVIESDHKRFSKGTRFDFGFFSIATNEGYIIISLPMDKIYNQSTEGENLQ